MQTSHYSDEWMMKTKRTNTPEIVENVFLMCVELRLLFNLSFTFDVI